MNNKGTLYIVGTPIGNLDDITLRALKTLENVDAVLCEDTRQTIKLLNHYNISNHLISYHKYNERESVNKVIENLEKGKNLALVSDAGLPLICDPGSILVQECRKLGYPIQVIPGPNAALSALQLSGLDTNRFIFFGFPPKNRKEQREFINEIINSPYTAAFYETPHHLIKTLEMLNELDPDRRVSISREITKKFEETLSGTTSELLEYFNEHTPKGEFVLVINKNNKPIKNREADKPIKILFNELIKEGYSEKEAIKKVAKIKNMNKRDIYSEIKIKK